MLLVLKRYILCFGFAFGVFDVLVVLATRDYAMSPFASNTSY